jgi:hypothetical protein
VTPGDPRPGVTLPPPPLPPMSTLTATVTLPFVCPACGCPMREADVHSGLIDRCPTCDARLAAPADDPALRETVRLSRAELAALWTG